MKQKRKRVMSVFLVLAMVLLTVPEGVYAAAGTSGGVEESIASSEETSEEAGETITTASAVSAKAETVSAQADSTGEEPYIVDTSYSYALEIKTSQTPVSSSNDTLKTLKISQPKLKTKTTYTWSDGSKTTSTETVTYEFTVRVHVNNIGFQTVTLGSDGYYTYTASNAASGYYMQAVQIIPSDELEAAMDAAGLTFYYVATVSYFGRLGWAPCGDYAGSTGNGTPLTKLEFGVISESDASSVDTTSHYISATNVYYSTKLYGASSWGTMVSNGTTSGSASTSAAVGALAVKIQNYNSNYGFSGGVQYSVRSTISNSSSNWSSWSSNYSSAGSSSKKLQAVKIKLTGTMAGKYDIYYRVYVGNYGWLDWASNGSAAGSEGIGLPISAIQIKIVPKGSGAPGDTDDCYIDSISGDSTLDGYLTAIYTAKGTSLQTLFYYVGNYSYIRYYVYPSGDWEDWSIGYAKDMYEKQGGNCYRYASLFCWLAIGLGYEARVVTGYVPSRSSGWAPHGWVEIDIGGTTYIYDPDLYHSYPTLNWYQRTYSSAPVTYKKSS